MMTCRWRRRELGQTRSKLEGTTRLFDKGFVTKLEMQQDEIASEKSRIKVQTAQSARDLFLKYDFLKSAEESLSVRRIVRRTGCGPAGGDLENGPGEARLRSAKARTRFNRGNARICRRNWANAPCVPPRVAWWFMGADGMIISAERSAFGREPLCVNARRSSPFPT